MQWLKRMSGVFGFLMVVSILGLGLYYMGFFPEDFPFYAVTGMKVTAVVSFILVMVGTLR